MDRENLRRREIVGREERVNFPFIGILLRLADIMDFDSSRTPAILFRHIGLETDLATRFSEISRQEWKKHLAITGIEWAANGELLTYFSANCPHPAVEKSIRDFITQINDEINQASSALHRLPDTDRCRIRLPKVEAQITPARNGREPAYKYYDWSFRLDQEEVIRLLMGEALYGDPTVCIRELLQNSLDALEMRDLRMQLLAKGHEPAEPVDGEWIGPGQFRFRDQPEKFEVKLSWGEEGGQQFLRVEDNGTGMTQEVIERYFTQIGKSFYRSRDFSTEQQRMLRYGLLATPISKFGIGVLSCFMIADRIQIRTHPGSISDARPALDIELSQPGSLFWTKSGTRLRQGTEVTVWLKKEVRGKPLRLCHDRDVCFDELRKIFGYSWLERRPTETIDPALVAAQYVVWPKYAIQIIPPGGEGWTLDARFHIDYLAPIDHGLFLTSLAKWDLPPSFAGNPRWEVLDWTDKVGEQATGTRVRFWLPCNPSAEKHLHFWELATCVAAQIPQAGAFTRITVYGMHVGWTQRLHDSLPFSPGLGCRTWIDLRGTAAPPIRADRREMVEGNDETESASQLGVWHRLVEWITSEQETEIIERVVWNDWVPDLAARLRARLKCVPKVQLVRASSGPMPWRLPTAAFFESTRRHYRNISQMFPRAHELVRWLDLDVLGALARSDFGSSAIAGALALDLGLDLARSAGLAAATPENTFRIDYTGMFAMITHVRRAAFPLSVRLSIEREDPSPPMVLPSASEAAALQTNWLQEAFFPSLSSSWPGLGLNGFTSFIGHAVLTAPSEFHIEQLLGADVFADPEGKEPAGLARSGYDLCFPMTAIPLGRLRREFPSWREDRRYRPLGVLPFLVPKMSEVWEIHATALQQLLPIGQIYAFFPALELWFKSFSQWTEADWNHPEHRSLLWDTAGGVVLVSPGVKDREACRREGERFTEFW